MRSSLRSLLFVSVLLGLLAGCNRTPASVAGRQVAVERQPAPEPTSPPSPRPPTETATVVPSPQPPTATASPHPPTPTATPTARLPRPTLPPPTLTPLHPLSIEAMRRRDYPGSEILIEETLAPGSGHQRFLASYRSEDLKIYGLLTVPVGERPAAGWPVVIFNHGYIRPPEYRTLEDYVPHVDALARHGYIVFKPDWRGHDRSHGSPSSGYGSSDYTTDVLNALAALRRFPEADPQRIGMWGHSLGGQLTLRAMVVSDQVRAGVIWAGVVAPYSQLLAEWRPPGMPTMLPVTRTPNARRWWQQRLVEEHGTPADNPLFWASISPNSYLADLSGPLQLHHGTADQIVPFQFSETLQEQTVAAGRYAELYLYEQEDHNLSHSFVPAVIRVINFFDRYLK